MFYGSGLSVLNRSCVHVIIYPRDLVYPGAVGTGADLNEHNSASLKANSTGAFGRIQGRHNSLDFSTRNYGMSFSHNRCFDAKVTQKALAVRSAPHCPHTLSLGSGELSLSKIVQALQTITLIMIVSNELQYIISPSENASRAASLMICGTRHCRVLRFVESREPALLVLLFRRQGV
jgi:hypothetical protein